MSEQLAKAWEEVAKVTAIKGTGRKISSPMFYRLLRLSAQPILRLFGVKWRGLHHVPKSGPAILAANHLSHVDPLYIIGGSRRTTYYLTKDEHFKKPHTAWFMRSTGQIETARESGATDALASAIDILSTGNVLGIFPEGTRSKRTEPPFLLQGKTGVARIASSMPDVPVIPVAHKGTREIMAPKTDKIPKVWKSASFNFGVPITWLEWLGDENGGGQNAATLGELVQKGEEEIRSAHAKLCRKFTDQFMQSLVVLGAP